MENFIRSVLKHPHSITLTSGTTNTSCSKGFKSREQEYAPKRETVVWSLTKDNMSWVLLYCALLQLLVAPGDVVSRYGSDGFTVALNDLSGLFQP